MEHKIKFCIKLPDNVTETFNKLTQASEDQVSIVGRDFQVAQGIFKGPKDCGSWIPF